MAPRRRPAPERDTLITASTGQHVLEVTPDKDAVWSVSGLQKVYEAERLRYGDEPRGPPMTELRDVDPEVGPEGTPTGGSGDLLAPLDEYYYLASWVIPGWITWAAFYSLHAVLLVGLVWGRFEWISRQRSKA